ncbi:aminotransferase class V-fold PLP-dependent enzyme [Maritimibacter sp. UBA3975]|uniref:aminotransferase class V-fold PLP-dependent enzyme n=1 Tax=Maritimibacter sp. UBA3975 TaxID=1946833 RepID=UPI000C09B5FC|nr:aminotransferase class V-fold PLP-dependent enzyme [Maritimibacter sp. UBA3975]MAM61558.1 nitrogen fixation protein NifS [Maritimibacter sp.]|tara:strand:- start:8523 stop:9788 length:1266 start_codon:yes stop_codon:yes gene_type:complete
MTKPDISAALMNDVRARFAHVDNCPFEGERVFFENAGGALTLNSVVETSARMAAIPDNQGRSNAASKALQDMIDTAKADMRVFFNAPEGQFFVGESGTELLFRLIRSACLGTPLGRVLGSTLEHPASRSAAARWSKVAGKPHFLVAHDDARGTVTAEDYAPLVTPDTVVATILHTSPVTGIGVDVAAVAAQIRDIAPDCFIIVDGIQHAAHGRLDIAAYGIDGYVISPYKVFSRHGYGVAWVSDRLAALPHDTLMGAPTASWELGTRDTGAYATFSDVVSYFDWLGGEVSGSEDRRSRIVAAGEAIHTQETALCHAMIHGTGNQKGLAEYEGVTILGGTDNPGREGLVCFALDSVPAPNLVDALNARGIRTHIRKADHYSGNILDPLGMEHCVRVSMCHYNTEAEVAQFLQAIKEITDAQG